MRASQLLRLCKKALRAWSDDFAPSMGAAIAYYTVFSLAPLLVIVIAVAGAVFGREAVSGQITEQLAGLIGDDGAMVVQGLVASASDTTRGLVAGTVSLAVLLVGATTVFAELQSALDRIWHVPEREKPQGLRAILRARLLSFGLIMGLAFLLMVSLAASAATAALGGWLQGLLPSSAWLLQTVNTAVSLGLTTVLFGMIYKLMPTVPIAWRSVWVGAGITAVLFELGKLLIGTYIGRSGLTESYQAAGSLVVILAWVYYAAQVFLLGAEFTKAYADEQGDRPAARAMAVTASNEEAVAHPPAAPTRPAAARPQGLEALLLARIESQGSRLVLEAVALAGLQAAAWWVQRRQARLRRTLSTVDRAGASPRSR